MILLNRVIIGVRSPIQWFCRRCDLSSIHVIAVISHVWIVAGVFLFLNEGSIGRGSDAFFADADMPVLAVDVRDEATIAGALFPCVGPSERAGVHCGDLESLLPFMSQDQRLRLFLWLDP